MVAVAELIGKGIYTPSEVALYVRERPDTIARWVLGKGGDPAFSRQFGEEERFVTFLDFVQSLAVAAIRREYGVSLQKIRKAIDVATTHYGVTYPLARPHQTVLYVKNDGGPPTDGQVSKVELLLMREGKPPVQLSGKNVDNYVLAKVAEPYLRRLEFDEDGLPKAYTAFSWKGKDVRMDPARRFGEPLTPSGYTVYALDDAVRAEGSVEEAASAYGVDRTEVELACRFLDHLKNDPLRDDQG